MRTTALSADKQFLGIYYIARHREKILRMLIGLARIKCPWRGNMTQQKREQFTGQQQETARGNDPQGGRMA